VSPVRKAVPRLYAFEKEQISLDSPRRLTN
jgi:hypothetical protein